MTLTQLLERVVGPGHVKWLWLSVAVLAADQLTKLAVVLHFGDYDTTAAFFAHIGGGGLPQGLFRRIELLPVLDLTLMVNTGAAFSFLADAGGWQRWLFIALAVGVTGFILVWLRTLPPRGHVFLALALALVLGGALGNLVDRALYGWVIDFIHLHWRGWYWPAFNIADSAITVGAVMLIIDAVVSRKKV